MINRHLIRPKVIQILYAYYQNPERRQDLARKELDFSLQKTHELYHLLLALLVKIGEYAQRREEVETAQQLRGSEGPSVATKALAHNAALQILSANQELRHYIEQEQEPWDDEALAVQKLYATMCEMYEGIAQELRDEADAQPFTFEQERTLLRRLFNAAFAENDDLELFVEQHGIYWNDDRYVIDTFVEKTIKQLTPSTAPEEPLLPAFSSEDDHAFALQLLEQSLLREEEIRHLIRESSTSWAYERIALMDIIIMQAATAEILAFPSIPVPVTVNEYVEIAKTYSTPQSGRFVNGLLGAIAKKLRDEQKILK